MKKRLIAMLFAIVLCFCTAVPAFAAGDDSLLDGNYRLNDLADLLSDSEEEALLQKLDEISERYGLDVVIATTKDLDGYKNATAYADHIYDFYGYGQGAKKSGILLLITTEDRKWALSTCGYGIATFTDAGLDYIFGRMKDDLAEDDYVGAFNTYADLCDQFILQAQTGRPYDVGNLPPEPLPFFLIPVSIAIGTGLAYLIVRRMKKQLKSVVPQAEASSYLKRGSLTLTESSDLFLNKTTAQTVRDDSDDSGGSSTHTSSSGTSHGGSSGSY